MAEYRRFIASSLSEAKRKMLKEMGLSAYIVKTRKITRKSFLGFKKTHLVEIQAGKMSDKTKDLTEKKGSRALPGMSLSLKEKQRTHRAFFDGPIDRGTGGEANDGLERIKKLINEKYLKTSGKTQQKPIQEKEKLEEAEIKQPLSASSFIHRTPSNGAYFPDSQMKAANAEKMGSDQITGVKNFLKDKEFSSDFADWIASRHQSIDPSAKEYQRVLARSIASQFKFTGPVKLFASNPNIILMVGPTGVGKTTTLAKIASHYAVFEGKSCVLATFDVRRIMATAQLEKFALIMGTPFRVLRQKSDLKKLINDFISKNLIFIDTAGTSHHDLEYLEEMEDFISYINIPKEIYLCLNASFRIKEMQKVIDHFKQLYYEKVIVTKCDESGSLGPALSVLHRYNLPLSYLTNGQDVPSHIVLADEKSTHEYLLKEWQ